MAREQRSTLGGSFLKLPPFAKANDTARTTVLEVGEPGGIMGGRGSAGGRPGARPDP
ncbi:MAG: hypothetical protein JO262_12280 [Solirubrobacterales bacterium]|nr:hypothetical protein [Solirubrobacterales bacterium]